jgi:predicted nucleic acid-binding protein
MASVFLDTNLLLYAAMRCVPDVDHFKKRVALQAIARGDFATSAQVLAEFYVNATRKGQPPLTAQEAMIWLDHLSIFPCIPVTSELVQSGAQLSARYQISYWDAAVLAAAHVAGCQNVYSEDLSHDQLYGSVKVINPFLAT